MLSSFLSIKANSSSLPPPLILSLSLSLSLSKLSTELANLTTTKGSPLEILEEAEEVEVEVVAEVDNDKDDNEPIGEKNKWIVRALYEALNARDADTVHRLLAPDIGWRFHGPPSRQHMMRLLTGLDDGFRFVPLSIEAFGPTVLVEGAGDRDGSAYWVHAWTVGPDGVVTQVREYFNTSVTVTAFSTTSSKKSKKSKKNHLPVWQSRLPENAGKSLPGLVLAL